ncbi:MAG: hypothetical protein KBE04_02285 [Phycisphaerae bacterium]|nr:hypothetical protein [Phycisphaerae bacterium]
MATSEGTAPGALGGFAERPSGPPRHSAGRYVFTPEIFDFLESTAPGKGGEIQLTDAMRAMVRQQPMYGKRLEGRRCDIGDKEGFIKTNIEFGLRDETIRTSLQAYIRQRAEDLG